MGHRPIVSNIIKGDFCQENNWILNEFQLNKQIEDAG